MATKSELKSALSALADGLASRRPAILRAWRTEVDVYPLLTTGSTMPRSQFNDHIPAVLDVFEDRLRQSGPVDDMEREQHEHAAAHGLQRWQQGYNLREVTREWGHLHVILVDELEAFAHREPKPVAEAMSIARRALAELFSQAVSESTSQYFELQQTEAAGHVRDLALTLNGVRELERRRVELWRQAAHDLRGHVGTVANVSAGLAVEGAPVDLRDDFVRQLQRSIASLTAMLDDVLDLARLEAGHEKPEFVDFDAAALLRELCEQMRALAQERGLGMRVEGPAELRVIGDPVKTHRIAQNLILNAIKYTTEGSVNVTWGDSRENDAGRWMLCIQDTGPGFHYGPAAPLADALEAASRGSRQIDEDAGVDSSAPADPGDGPDDSTMAASSVAIQPVNQKRGEGIGLSIVKRLAGLIDAAIEMESTPAVGSVVRVVLPRRPGERATP
ncbi:MAG: sensor histidine kinase [Burkholderiaceae bacterium]